MCPPPPFKAINLILDKWVPFYTLNFMYNFKYILNQNFPNLVLNILFFLIIYSNLGVLRVPLFLFSLSTFLFSGQIFFVMQTPQKSQPQPSNCWLKTLLTIIIGKTVNKLFYLRKFFKTRNTTTKKPIKIKQNWWGKYIFILILIFQKRKALYFCKIKNRKRLNN